MIESELRVARDVPQMPNKISWLQRALPVLAVLACLNIGVNIWQSWRDRVEAETLAASRVSVLATLTKSFVQSQVNAIDAGFGIATMMVETNSVSDAGLAQTAESLSPLLRDLSLSVYGSDDRLMATSRPLQPVDGVAIAALLKEVRKQPASTHVTLLSGDGTGTLYFARAHLDKAGEHDSTLIMAKPAAMNLFGGIDVGANTLVLLHDGDQVVARLPPVADIPVGSRIPDNRDRRHGPAPGTFYSKSALDGQERLFTQRDILLDSGKQRWSLDVGYLVDSYRSAWRQSLYLNLTGITIIAAMLISGALILRREQQIRHQRQAWTRLANRIVQNMPMAVAVVDADDETIILGNDASLVLFGAMASPGQPFPKLFSDASAWEKVRSSEANEAISMLTRTGHVEMAVHCRFVEAAGNASSMLLVTMTDVSRQAQQMKQLQAAADLDVLTQLPNRRYFELAAEQLVASARENASELAVITLDLDHFKRVNDTYGHAAGDRVLSVVAKLIAGAFRDVDVAARTGGEEFCVLLPDASLEQARLGAERLRRAVEGTPIFLPDGSAMVQTVSVGLSSYLSSEPDIQAALQRADAALYEAKAAGRNRVVVAPSDVASASDKESRAG